VETVARAHPDDPVVHYLRGKLAFLQGDLRVAMDLLERYLKLRPDDADAQFASGVVLTRAGKFVDAVKRMERAAELLPHSLDVRVALARTRYSWAESLMRRGRFREAQGALRKASLEDPGAKAPRHMLVKSLALGGNVELSEREVRLLLRQDPDDPVARRMLAGVYLMREEFDRAAEELERVVRILPEDWATWIMLATVQLRRAAPVEALRAARKARAAAPAEPLSMAGVVQVLMETGETAQARRELGALIKAVPEAAYYRYLAALVELRDDRVKTALPLLEEALDREPGMAIALRLAVGLLTTRLNDDQAALALAAERAPKALESLEMQHIHADLQWRFGERDDAVDRLVQLSERDPPYLPSVALLAGIHAEQGRITQGRDVLSTALEVFPEVPDLHYLIGESYLRQAVARSAGGSGTVPEPERGLALTAFQRANELRPQHPPTLNTLAYLLAQSEDTLQEALEHIHLAVTIAPDYVSYMDTQATILMALDKPQAAVEVLRRALGILDRAAADLRQAETEATEDARTLAARRARHERTDREVRANYEKALEAAEK